MPTKEVFVGPNRLPQALRPDLTPEKVKTALATALESGRPESAAAEDVAKTVAVGFNWQIKVIGYYLGVRQSVVEPDVCSLKNPNVKLGLLLSVSFSQSVFSGKVLLFQGDVRELLR